jgi:hypothetical protein
VNSYAAGTVPAGWFFSRHCEESEEQRSNPVNQGIASLHFIVLTMTICFSGNRRIAMTVWFLDVPFTYEPIVLSEPRENYVEETANGKLIPFLKLPIFASRKI